MLNKELTYYSIIQNEAVFIKCPTLFLDDKVGYIYQVSSNTSQVEIASVYQVSIIIPQVKKTH